MSELVEGWQIAQIVLSYSKGHTKQTLGLQFATSDKIIYHLSAVHTLQNYTYTSLLGMGTNWFKLLPECTIKYSCLF